MPATEHSYVKKELTHLKCIVIKAGERKSRGELNLKSADVLLLCSAVWKRDVEDDWGINAVQLVITDRGVDLELRKRLFQLQNKG